MENFKVTLNRPKALNALCSPLFTELNDALSKYDSDKEIGAIIITGSEKAFAGKFAHSSSESHEIRSTMLIVDSWCRHQRNGPPDLLRRVHQQLHCAVVAPRQLYPQTRYRCCLGLRPRRWLRACPYVRHHLLHLHRNLRPARDQARRDPRCRWIPASDAGGREEQSHGADFDRQEL